MKKTGLILSLCLVAACAADLGPQSSAQQDGLVQEFGELTAATTLNDAGMYAELMNRAGEALAVVEWSMETPESATATLVDSGEAFEIELVVSPDAAAMNELVYDVWTLTHGVDGVEPSEMTADGEGISKQGLESRYSHRFVRRRDVIVDSNLGIGSQLASFCWTDQSCGHACRDRGRGMGMNWCVATGPKKAHHLARGRWVITQHHTTACFCNR